MILEILGIIQGIELGIIFMYYYLISSGYAISGVTAFPGVIVAAFPFCLGFGVIAWIVVSLF